MGVEVSFYRVGQVFAGFESVRCLSCGSEYSKPVGGGTTAANPGCPECAYLGWRPVNRSGERPQYRSAAGLPQRQTA
jgi:hypothetical protein